MNKKQVSTKNKERESRSLKEFRERMGSEARSYQSHCGYVNLLTRIDARRIKK